MTPVQRRLTIGIFTATQWHSDHGSGRALLTLGSTYKVHNEDHRINCLADIDHDLAWLKTHDQHHPDAHIDPVKETARLTDLRELVVGATIGEAWLTDAENMRFNEELYRANAL